MIQKILIANRGEIAVRIARTCREMGISTVAVHSNPDANALHVQVTDESIALPGETSAETYLQIEKIVEAAKRSGADAIHPGYGFLSENAEFAEAVVEAGLVFIGPSPSAIREMGSKSRSKALMEKAGVPVVPGTRGDGTDVQALAEEAKEIPLPVLIKASAGGGGKGMRIVHKPQDLLPEMERAAREAEKAFGDPTLLVERYVESPRHIEIQVFGDQHGTIHHLFERECSVQRRHQKVIEESPAPGLSAATREAMGKAAVAAAEAVAYTGAGTVEFIVDPDEQFYFLEMNTRLQVEHPVTEAVTGLDLVREQIRVAEGSPLSFHPDDLEQLGAAIECRIYAEDPSNQFLPCTGTLEAWEWTEDESLRMDTGVQAGDTISVFYDPMLAKVITHGETREDALRKMSKALEQFVIQGVVTNLEFLEHVVKHPTFVEGKATTHFIQDTYPRGFSASREFDGILAMHAAVLESFERDQNRTNLPGVRLGFRNNPFARQWTTFAVGEEEFRVEYEPLGSGRYAVTCGAHSAEIAVLENAGQRTRMQFNGHSRVVRRSQTEDSVFIQIGAHRATLEPIPRFPVGGSDEDAGSCLSPMPGKVVALNVEVGQAVQKGQTLAAIEAMKMEHPIVAAEDGRVTDVLVALGDQVQAQAALVVIEAHEGTAIASS